MADTTTPVAATSLEERLKQKIRDELGSLLTDDELKAIIHKGIDSIFFEPRTVKSGFSTSTEPPLIEELLKHEVENQVAFIVQRQVETFFTENKDEIASCISDALQQGLGNAVLRAIEMKFSGALFDFQQRVTNMLQAPM